MNGNVPTWVKVIAQVGFPIVVAVWLLIVTNDRLARTSEAMQTHLEQTQVQTALLRAICRHGAKTDAQADLCDRL